MSRQTLVSAIPYERPRLRPTPGEVPPEARRRVVDKLALSLVPVSGAAFTVCGSCASVTPVLLRRDGDGLAAV